MGTGEFNAGGYPVMDWHPIQGGVEIFLVASCHGNRDKLWPDGPLGSYTDFNSRMTHAVVVHYFVRSYDVTLTGILFDRSKIFIRFPQTLFATEDAFQAKKPALGMLQCQKLQFC